jgi:hypothetical protein
MKNKSYILEQTATVVPTKYPFVITDKIQYLSNDSSEYTLKINFDGDIGQAGSRTLYAGETINDIPMYCNYITVQATNGDGTETVAFRLSGV